METKDAIYYRAKEDSFTDKGNKSFTKGKVYKLRQYSKEELTLHNEKGEIVCAVPEGNMLFINDFDVAHYISGEELGMFELVNN